MIPVNLVFEDAISEFIMIKLLNSFEQKYFIGNSYSGNGFGYIKSNISGFNEASWGSAFFVLTDLDNNKCPIQLIKEWLPKVKNPNLIFRIAVREIESWVLADKTGFSNYTGVSARIIPGDPDNISDPKKTLIDIVTKSRKRSIKEDIIPINQNASIGPNYNDRLIEFVSNYWDIFRAVENSDSLRRAYTHLEAFKFQYKS